MDSQNASRPAELSLDAAMRQVRSDTLQDPLVVIPAGIGVVGACATGLFLGVSAAIPALIFTGGVAFAGGRWALNFFGKKDEHVLEYFREQRALRAEDQSSRARELETKLVGVDCAKGTEQLEHFRSGIERLREILYSRLTSGELMFVRCLEGAEQVYASGLRSLNQVADLLSIHRNADIRGWTKDIVRLEKLTRDDADERTLSAVKLRKKIYDDAQAEIKRLLADNEMALTTIEQLIDRVAHIEQGDSTSLDSIIESLARLVKRSETSITLDPSDPK
ncbi:MAG: hypothetical protein RLZZ347_363 [Candidatus Parcubacteria bacterium]|jgi:hypothetical protein